MMIDACRRCYLIFKTLFVFHRSVELKMLEMLQYFMFHFMLVKIIIVLMFDFDLLNIKTFFNRFRFKKTIGCIHHFLRKTMSPDTVDRHMGSLLFKLRKFVSTTIC
jgi:hypothetical protein